MQLFVPVDSISEETKQKMNKAPLTISWWESNLSQLGFECKRGAWLTKLQTLTDRHVAPNISEQRKNGNKIEKFRIDLNSPNWRVLSPVSV